MDPYDYNDMDHSDKKTDSKMTLTMTVRTSNSNADTVFFMQQKQKTIGKVIPAEITLVVVTKLLCDRFVIN